MGKYKKKPIVIEAITFDELVAHGLAVGGNVVNGMPWSFEYKGHRITHENDECYLIPTLEGTHNMTPKDMLITGVQGEIYPCKVDIFGETYDQVTEGGRNNTCTICNGTGFVSKYFDAGDHFGAGASPNSGFESIPCKCCQA